MQTLTEPYEDYFYQFSDLSGSQRQLRLESLAAKLDCAIREAGGLVGREEALRALADQLGTSVEEIRIGIVLGEGRGLFTRTEDGLRLRAL